MVADSETAAVGGQSGRAATSQLSPFGYSGERFESGTRTVAMLTPSFCRLPIRGLAWTANPVSGQCGMELKGDEVEFLARHFGASLRTPHLTGGMGSERH